MRILLFLRVSPPRLDLLAVRTLSPLLPTRQP